MVIYKDNIQQYGNIQRKQLFKMLISMTYLKISAISDDV